MVSSLNIAIIRRCTGLCRWSGLMAILNSASQSWKSPRLMMPLSPASPKIRHALPSNRTVVRSTHGRWWRHSQQSGPGQLRPRYLEGCVCQSTTACPWLARACGIPQLGLVPVPPAHAGFALVKAELGTMTSVAARIVPSRSFTALSLSIWFTPPRICSAMRCFSSRWRTLRIVVSTEIRLFTDRPVPPSATTTRRQPSPIGRHRQGPRLGLAVRIAETARPGCTSCGQWPGGAPPPPPPAGPGS